MNSKRYLFFILALFCFGVQALELQEHEKWWDVKCKERNYLAQFNSWVGNENALSRVLTRLYITYKGYKTILDIPCGLCVDYDAFKRTNPDIYYLGVDCSSTFIDAVTARGIPAMRGKVQDIPCQDSSFDVILARHILEHLDSYQTAIQEMVRVAKKEVLIIFFIKPIDGTQDKTVTADVNGYPIYHNRYSKSKLETFLKSLDKVKNFTWQEVKNQQESILHILV